MRSLTASDKPSSTSKKPRRKSGMQEHNLPYKNQNARKNDPEDQKPPRHIGLTEPEKGQLKVREQDCWIWNRRKERYQPMAQQRFQRTRSRTRTAGICVNPSSMGRTLAAGIRDLTWVAITKRKAKRSLPAC